jgi:hypothetical protein
MLLYAMMSVPLGYTGAVSVNFGKKTFKNYFPSALPI